MNHQDKTFLDSGIIEDYTLGIASPDDTVRLMELSAKYPTMKYEMDRAVETLHAVLDSCARVPPSRLKVSILNAVKSKKELAEAKTITGTHKLENFIPISTYSNADSWDRLTLSIKPPTDYDNIHAVPIFHEDGKELVVIWAKEHVPEEIHTEEMESFFILEGTVDCHVGDDVYKMERGDYMRIPMEVNHKVIVTSSTPAKAIMSRVAISA